MPTPDRPAGSRVWAGPAPRWPAAAVRVRVEARRFAQWQRVVGGLVGGAGGDLLCRLAGRPVPVAELDTLAAAVADAAGELAQVATPATGLVRPDASIAAAEAVIVGQLVLAVGGGVELVARPGGAAVLVDGDGTARPVAVLGTSRLTAAGWALDQAGRPLRLGTDAARLAADCCHRAASRRLYVRAVPFAAAFSALHDRLAGGIAAAGAAGVPLIVEPV